VKPPRSFYDRPTLEVARDLIGCLLVREVRGARLTGVIVETEAYTADDPGSHAFRGRTRRTEVMFGPPGHLYVYFTYGMHHCMNVVTETEGIAGAVLLRAAQPLEGMEQMERARGPRPPVELCNGPAKLCQAFGITRADNGQDLEGPEVWIEDDGQVAHNVAISTRVGLTAGRELPFRFYLADNPYVSPGRPSALLPGEQIMSGGGFTYQKLPVEDSHRRS
jgi:DNA-3-methyladenine glycosylase